MYIPNAFKLTARADQIAFMKRYSFATIINCKDQHPIATHLPFHIDQDGGSLVLSSHFAAANGQTKIVEQSTSLVIFSQPHAYVSPRHYDKQESVPTWDYLAVHAYGKARILQNENAKLKALEKMICFYEQNYMEQWKGLSEAFKKGMMKGIVVFEIEVTDLQGQQKLSQNKKENERERIIQELSKSTDSVEKDLATYIRDLGEERG